MEGPHREVGPVLSIIVGLVARQPGDGEPGRGLDGVIGPGRVRPHERGEGRHGAGVVLLRFLRREAMPKRRVHLAQGPGFTAA